MDLDEPVENPRYGREIKAEIMRRLEKLDESYEEAAEAVGLPAEVVRKIAHKHGFSEEEHQIRKLEELTGETERWTPMPGSDTYEISSFGRVIRKDTGEFVEHEAYRIGGRRGRYHTIAKLVAVAFLGDKPGMRVVHKDGDTKNNFWRNLEWVTPSKLTPRRDEILRRLAAGEKQAALAAELDVHPVALRAFAREAGLPPRLPKSAVSEALRQEIIRRTRSGERREDIAKDIGVISKSYVGKIARELGDVRRIDPWQFRNEIKSEAEAGSRAEDIAEKFGVSERSVVRVIKALRESGELSPSPIMKVSDELRREIVDRVDSGATTGEVAEALGLKRKQVWQIAYDQREARSRVSR